MVQTWVCRVRFSLPRYSLASIPEDGLRFDLPSDLTAEFESLGAKGGEGADFAIHVSPFPDEAGAHEWGMRSLVGLKRAGIAIGLGMNVGDRRNLDGGLSPYAIDLFAKNAAHPIRNERLGFDVYESGNRPKWFSTHLAGISTRSAANLMDALATGIGGPPLSGSEEIAFELWSAGQFIDDPEARFLLFFMAFEALVQPIERSPEAEAHVNHLIALTDTNPDLTKGDRESMKGSLRWLKSESIRQAGRRTCQRLPADDIGGSDLLDLYDEAYELRNLLTHPREKLPEVARAVGLASSMEKLVRVALQAGSNG